MQTRRQTVREELFIWAGTSAQRPCVALAALLLYMGKETSTFWTLAPIAIFRKKLTDVRSHIPRVSSDCLAGSPSGENPDFEAKFMGAFWRESPWVLGFAVLDRLEVVQLTFTLLFKEGRALARGGFLAPAPLRSTAPRKV